MPDHTTRHHTSGCRYANYFTKSSGETKAGRVVRRLCSEGLACDDESWSGAVVLWCQVSERCDWQPRSSVDCDDQKVEAVFKAKVVARWANKVGF